jgi:peptidoglycan/LPS O-acetylase OafA/YrhL
MLNEFIKIEPIDGAHWYIFTILKFYIITSIIILLKLTKFQKYIAGIWLIISIITIHYQIPIVNFFIIPKYSTFIISGIILYTAKKEGWDIYKYITLLMSLILSIYIVNNYIPKFNLHYSTKISPYIVSTIILIIYLFMYMSTINNKQLKLPKYVTTISISTYPLYLIHQNFGYVILNKTGHIINKYPLLIITILLMITLSIIITKFVEPKLCNLITHTYNKIKTQSTKSMISQKISKQYNTHN